MANEIRFMTFNMGGGAARSTDPLVPVYGDVRPVVDELAALIGRARPHVACLQEVPIAHPWHKGPGGRVQNAATLLRNRLGGAAWRLRNSEVHPYNSTDRLGMVIFSRWPLRDYGVRRPGRRAREKSPVQRFQVVDRRKNLSFWVFNYHGNVRLPGWGLLGLRNFIKRSVPVGNVSAVLGDFNIRNQPDSSYARFGAFQRERFQDCCRESGGGPCETTVNTDIHRRGGGVDYIWINRGGRRPLAPSRLRVRSAPEINSRVTASDHLPLIARVDVRELRS